MNRPATTERSGWVERVIEWSGHNVLMIGLLTLLGVGAAVYALASVPLDAIPDLSDVQVIVSTNWEGRSPSIIENQITYPITTRFIGAPHVKAVRGLSMPGRSFVYVIFDDGTDIYWARARVLESLNGVQSTLPEGVLPQLGPDATGLGWVFQYALVDPTGRTNLTQLRTLQDWTLKYALSSVKGVAEVASIGGNVKEYQVNVDPRLLARFGVTLDDIADAVRRSNTDVGGRSIEISAAEYHVRGLGSIASLDDIRRIVIKPGPEGKAVTVGQIGSVEFGGAVRDGLAEFNGKGEAVGGIVVMRYGENALNVIRAVKSKIDSLRPALPPGVEIVPVYDRSGLIERSIDTLRAKLLEESAVVSLVCLIFLWHLRSSLVVIVMLPVAVLLSFIPFAWLHLTANIMSLGGIAIAIGAMVDAAIVMVESAHKELEQDRFRLGRELTSAEHASAILLSARRMGRPLFFSLLVITASFIPVFTLAGPAGRLFQPLAFTKTFAMLAAAILSVTLVPALMILLIRGRIQTEARNPLNRLLVAAYLPLVEAVVRWRWTVLAVALFLLLLTLVPVLRLGSEFMPPLNEGDFLFMPTSPHGLAEDEAARVLHEQNVRLAQVPEFLTVFGKAGSAETATDPAPFSMFETTIQVRPPDEWRPGMTWDKLRDEIQARGQTPGMANILWMPIQTRTEMLTTGFRSNLGLRVYGRSLRDLSQTASEIAQALGDLPGTRSVIAEEPEGGRYLDIAADRVALARRGLDVGDVNDFIETAVGGATVTTVLESRERYPLTVRLQTPFRDNILAIRDLVLPDAGRAKTPPVRLSDVTDIRFASGPSEIKSENGQLVSYVSVDATTPDIGGYVVRAEQRLHDRVHVPAGVYWEWAGEFQQLREMEQRLWVVVPFTLLIIVLLLLINTRSLARTLFVLLMVPFSLIGAFWLLDFFGYQFSAAVAVGLIALAGIDAETGVVMLIYLDQACDDRARRGALKSLPDLVEAVKEGAARRIRPKLMTMAAILFGLLPIMWSNGSGSEVMKRIATPMIGGVITSAALGLLLYPALYVLWRGRRLPR
ncbi:MAG: CusA/CzcA family heavy metal efflux RND transporter [Methylacidiphilales bacterium]|nr:CusA/CzcA family heavy metal efflux RND transporter [Candidatus Methylacidiphilales bacterium]